MKYSTDREGPVRWGAWWVLPGLRDDEVVEVENYDDPHTGGGDVM